MKNIEELLPKNVCEISGKVIKITSDEFYSFTINKRFNNIGMLNFKIYDARKRSTQSVISVYQFIKYLIENKVKNINIKASDELIPVYIDVLNRLNYVGESNISLYIERMTIEEKEYLPLDLDKSKSKIDIPSGRLLWQPQLSKLEKVIDMNTLKETKMLHRHIYDIYKKMSEQYYSEKFTSYDKILYVYDYIKKLDFKYKSDFEIAKLISALLNNPTLKVDAKVITGKLDNQDYSFIGIVNSEEKRILECLPTIDNYFKKTDIKMDKPNILLERTQNLDAYLYDHYNIDDKDEKKLRMHLECLKKK